MADAPDISRVISLIMQNPRLIEEISELARADSPVSEAELQEKTETATEAIPEAREAVVEPIMPRAGGGRRDQRVKLLGAMKAYLSPERAKAVDTMMNILDILEMTGGRG